MMRHHRITAGMPAQRKGIAGGAPTRRRRITMRTLVPLLVTALILQLSLMVFSPIASPAAADRISSAPNLDNSLMNGTDQELKAADIDHHHTGTAADTYYCAAKHSCVYGGEWGHQPPSTISQAGGVGTWSVDSATLISATYGTAVYLIGDTGWWVQYNAFNAGPIGTSYAQCAIHDSYDIVTYTSVNGTTAGMTNRYICSAVLNGSSPKTGEFSLSSATPVAHHASGAGADLPLDTYCASEVPWNCHWTLAHESEYVYTEPNQVKVINCHPKNSNAGTVTESVTTTTSYAETIAFDSITTFSVSVPGIIKASTQLHLGHTWGKSSSKSYTEGLTVQPGRWAQLELSYPVHTMDGSVSYTLGNDSWVLDNVSFSYPKELNGKLVTVGGDVEPGDCRSGSSKLTVATSPAVPMTGQPVTYTATVDTEDDPSISAPARGGSVSFVDSDGTLLCPARPVVNKIAQCTATVVHNGADHLISAKYSGDAYWSKAWYSTVVRNAPQTYSTPPTYLDSSTPAGQNVLQSCKLAPQSCTSTTDSSVTEFEPYQNLGGSVAGCVDGATASQTLSWTYSTTDSNTLGLWASLGSDFPAGLNVGQEFDIDYTTTNTTGTTISGGFTAGLGYVGQLQTASLRTRNTGSVVFSNGDQTTVVRNVSTSWLAVRNPETVAANPANSMYRLLSSPALPGNPCKGTTTATRITATTNDFNAERTAQYQATVLADDGKAPTGTVTFTNGDKVICKDVAVTSMTSAASASCPVPLDKAGTSEVKASYSGILGLDTSATYLPSSDTTNLTVLAATTSVQLVNNGLIAGQHSDLIAVVASTDSFGAPGAKPTGTVTFSDENGPICGPIKKITTVYHCDFIPATTGNHTYVAAYSGSDTTKPATSSPTTFAVKAAATVKATASSNAVGVGIAVPLSATVSGGPGLGVPTGSVTFTDGSTLLCQRDLSNATASCAASMPTAGSRSIAVQYSGDSTYASASTTLTMTVRDATAMTLTAATPNPSVLLAQTYTATVSSTQLTDGIVTFWDGDSLMCSVAVSSTARSAVCRQAFTTAGAHAITAKYSGDIANGPGQATLTDTVSLIKTKITAPAPSAIQAIGSSTTLSAQVAIDPPAEIGDFFNGRVTITDGGSTLCTATAVGTNTAPAACKYAFTSAGIHHLTVAFSGDQYNQPSSTTVDVTVRASTSVLLFSSVAAPAWNTPQAFQVTMMNVDPTPGTITFLDGTQPLCTITPTLVRILNSNWANASCPMGAQRPGSHTITARYSGDGTYAPAEATLTEVVASTATSITPGATVAPQKVGSSMLLSAAVATQNPARTGLVRFSEGGIDLCGPLGLPASGIASVACGHVFDTVGSHLVTISYSGDAYESASTAQFTLTMTAEATSGSPLTATADCRTGLISWTQLNTLPDPVTLSADSTIENLSPMMQLNVAPGLSMTGSTRTPGGVTRPVTTIMTSTITTTSRGPLNATMPTSCSADVVGGIGARTVGTMVNGHVRFSGLVAGTQYGATFTLTDQKGTLCGTASAYQAVASTGTLDITSSDLKVCGLGVNTLRVTDVYDTNWVYYTGWAHLAVPSGGTAMSFEVLPSS